MTKTCHLFISHSWSYLNAYNGLIQLLERDPDFDYRNCSVSRNNPIHNVNNDSQLRQAIKDKTQPCSVILILAGIYATYSKWINKEIGLAKKGFSRPKPIIPVETWGSNRTSSVVKHAAQRVVRWNSRSVINAIKEVIR